MNPSCARGSDSPAGPAAREAHPLPFTDQRPSRQAVEAHQLVRLNALLARLRENSAFYRDRLPASGIESLAQLRRLPFTVPRDIADRGTSLIAVPASRVTRMVAIPTSGTSGTPKRIACTEGDLEDTRAFFVEGIRCIARAGETTAVLFPGETPLGLGSLIADALERLGARPLAIGIPKDLGQTLRDLAGAGATSAVGSAATLHALARRHLRNGGDDAHPENPALKRVLVSSDNASEGAKAEISRAWGCEVFEHYGMTETGYGIAVDCRAHSGMHIREFDLLVEIVDPETGRPLPDGIEGEVVITTLSREAMPLIRYRTGDLSRIIPGTCPCGGTLRRLGKVRGHALAR